MLTTFRTVAAIVIGVLYAIGAGRQALYVTGHSQEFYSDMADRAWIPPAETFIEKVLLPNSVVITLLVAVFQAVIAIAITETLPSDENASCNRVLRTNRPHESARGRYSEQPSLRENR